MAASREAAIAVTVVSNLNGKNSCDDFTNGLSRESDAYSNHGRLPGDIQITPLPVRFSIHAGAGG